MAHLQRTPEKKSREIPSIIYLGEAVETDRAGSSSEGLGGTRVSREEFERFENSNSAGQQKDPKDTLNRLVTTTKMNIKPKHFREDLESVHEWLRSFESTARANAWSDEEKINCLPCYLSGTPQKWFYAFEASSGSSNRWTWNYVKRSLEDNFGGVIQKQEWKGMLSRRVQGQEEDSTVYFHDVIDLCNKVDPAMLEEDKIQHVMEGLAPEILRMIALADNGTLKKLRDNIEKVRVTSSVIVRRERLKSGVRGYQFSGVHGEMDGPASDVTLLRQKMEVMAMELGARNESQGVGEDWKTKKPDENGQLVRIMRELSDDIKMLKGEVNAIQQGSDRRGWAPRENFRGRGEDQQGFHNQRPNRGGFQSGGWPRSGQRTATGSPVCYFCGLPGHFIMDCRKQQRASQLEKQGRAGNSDTGNEKPRQ